MIGATCARARRSLALLAACCTLACGGAPTGGVAAPALPRRAFERLSLEPGPASPLRVGKETRAGARLHAGEERVVRFRAERGDRLVLAVSGLPEAGARGHLELVARLGERELARVAAPLDGAWHEHDVGLDKDGPAVLTLRVDHVTARAPARAPSAPEIALATPRLYRAGAGAGRVFIWISQDTLRADHLGAYGYARATSPRFDAFVRDFVLFEHASASAPWTLPSLASQFTSRHPSAHGAVLHHLAISDATLMDALAADGFSVLGVTANDLVCAANNLARGFDALWFVKGRAQKLGERLLEVLGEWRGGDLAVFVHYLDPHTPYNPPAPYDRRFDDPAYRGRVTGISMFPQAFPVIGPVDRAHLVALYDGEIAYADEQIGELLEAFRRRGLLERAVIAYSSDHGEEFQDHGGWQHGSTLYEEVLHVPFALRLPGVAGRREATPVSMLDFAPTVLDALGVRAPASFQGRSLLPLLRGARVTPGPAFAETLLAPDHDLHVSVRDGGWKCIASVPRGQQPPRLQHEELYDLASDPHEERSDPKPAYAARLREALAGFVADVHGKAPPPRPIDLSPETLEQLKAFGYIQ